MPTPEQLARENIDSQLKSCGWVVQDRAEMNLYAGRGVDFAVPDW
jgi:type I restriction enzyme R subunit